MACKCEGRAARIVQKLGFKYDWGTDSYGFVKAECWWIDHVDLRNTPFRSVFGALIIFLFWRWIS